MRLFFGLAIASGLLFSVSATVMLAGQIGIVKGKRVILMHASAGRLYWLLLLPVLPAIPSYIFLWQSGNVCCAGAGVFAVVVFLLLLAFFGVMLFLYDRKYLLPLSQKSGQDYRVGKWFVLVPCAMATALVWELLLSCLYVLLARELVLC